jgi:uncharacterized membrane protein
MSSNSSLIKRGLWVATFLVAGAGHASAVSYTSTNIASDFYRSHAAGINDVGQIAGEQTPWVGSGGPGQIFRWDSPTSQAGTQLTGARYDYWIDATGINNAGTVVGG